MKYFTPKLLARCRSLDDNEAEVADQAWQKAIAAYQGRLGQIRKSLPLGARQLLKRISLHDARLLTIIHAWTSTGGELCLTFRLARASDQSARGVELRYRLSGPVKVLPHEPPTSDDGPVSRWVLHDEFNMVLKKKRGVFTHSLLLSGGLEFQIPFVNLRLKQFGMVLLADSRPSEIENELAKDHQLATA
jgi:hypothetical protein